MARRRQLDPDFWLDEDLAKLSPHARLLYMGLWGICDDNYATLPNRPEWIKAQIFPYESVSITQLLQELSDNSKIVLFEDDEKQFWYIKNFFKYQKVEKPSKPKYPEYFEAKKINTTGRVGEESVNTLAKEKLSEEKLSEEKLSEVDEEKPTPKKIMENFIQSVEERNDHYQSLLEYFVSNGVPDSIAEREVLKFYNYWTELSRDGKKQKWQSEKFFDLNKRLARWFGNVNEFKPSNQRIGKNYDE